MQRACRPRRSTGASEQRPRADLRDRFRELMDGEGGFVYAGRCGDPACETQIKEDTKATIRCLPDEEFRLADVPTACLHCGRPPTTEHCGRSHTDLRLLPGDGALSWRGVLERIAREVGTPMYVYSADGRDRYLRLDAVAVAAPASHSLHAQGQLERGHTSAAARARGRGGRGVGRRAFRALWPGFAR